ncbi:HAMP domain-containing histidine kinase [Paenibacillus albiflavus]|uniref:histidine kinase n=1 Tax=Paenibacillus albiflavus TaxID=2545760 RepID=A0A4R4E319_9BACL|nr:HAMP domain-containing sensor histidine kinase [Paenibacillus albiflavus]TCZ73030.1 HAMP domain-containing histidine kinase [Paenibacillus albiflavus]
MSIRKRLTGQFVWQLLLAGLLMIALIVATFFYIANKMSEIEVNQNFGAAGLSKLVDSLEMKDGNITFDNQLLEIVDRHAGWLQVLNEEGKVITSYHTPKDVPNAYIAGELTSYYKGQMEFPYHIYIWIQTKNNTMYTLVYGVPKTNKGLLLLHHVKQTAVINEGKINLPAELSEQLQAVHGYIQVLDSKGTEVASRFKAANALSQYTVQELVLRSQYSDRYNSQLFLEYDEITKQTWLLHVPLTIPYSDSSPELVILLIGFICIVTTIVIIFLFLSLWYGKRFGTPILHMMNWLHNLAQGKYEEPRDVMGRPKSRTITGRIRRKYQMYSDILGSLQQLTEGLQRNDEIRLQLETTRNEWITGVTHDMKTPLSSILGYAHMLKADHYQWSNREVHEFAAIIQEKADYMDLLISDLSMTYRLQNDAHFLVFDQMEINQFVQTCIVQFMNDPQYETAEITLEQANEPIDYPIDQNGFRRIIMNLLANAFIHNPSGTKVQVTIYLDSEGFGILFQDNGEGMDQITMNQLFDRYYRGTNTEGTTNGTGLGMAITKQLVLKHGGTIKVSSATGQGTQFKLYFSN